MKPGRNEPCNCGSGKKFKHCCERKAVLSPSAPPPVESNQLFALLNAGRYAELESRARLLVSQYPNFSIGWKSLGVSLHMQGKDSLVTFQKTVELFPGDADAHNNLGNALKDREQFRSAAASYSRALKIKPNLVGTLCNLGMVLH
ncbi:MAG: tetratricopeptide repeat protein, partial [Gallionella sp.]